jgi:branched-chain amino acid transport system permease protein
VSTVLHLVNSAQLLGSQRADEFVQQTINGLTLGAVYALIALGYSMVYGVLKLLNFAHGDVYMVGAFIGFGMIQWLGFRGEGDTWAPVVSTWFVLLIVFAVAMAGTAGLGVAIERFAYRPLRNAPRIAPLISALGVSFFIAYSMQLMFGAQQRDYNVFAIDEGRLFLTGWDVPFTTVRLPLLRILIIASAFVLMILLWLLVTRTRMGKAMRS